MENTSKKYLVGAASRFIHERATTGGASFSLDELIAKTGLSVVAARNQLLRIGDRIARISPRQQFFLIVSPEHHVFGAPPVEWWLDDYMQWLASPYYLALLSAATVHGSSPQAIQQTQVMTDQPRRDIVVGRVHIKFFMKSAIGNTLKQQLPNAYAPLLLSTPESTMFDLVRYAHKLGGIERMGETIAPMLRKIKVPTLRKVLEAEQEIATSQRLGFVLEAINAPKLAEVVEKWLPGKLQPVPLSNYTANSKRADPNARWGVINNTGSFA